MVFIEKLKEEIVRLEIELLKIPAYVKLHQMRRVLDLYENGFADRRLRKPRKTKIERQQAARAVWEFLQNQKEPVPVRVIYEHVESLGITLGGKDPQNNLSAMLSNSTRFKSHGHKGWTRIELGEIHD